ncbi:STAS domain-containing protein [Acidiphilium sp. PA]|uniref:STAS domain-containing protein n=1 Tax=Acidiphilium sp. PA TaxID=2871705 RepID=UPI002244A38E|nr:STAS domain-containing protein [Acidiphilium sp. PA]MCW8308633.1 STAS domain-containing protein [Acidiphilium sp. PA]
MPNGTRSNPARTKEFAKPIAFEELAGNITKVVLSGRIDIAGASAIDMPMSLVGGSKKAVIVDLAGVEFMASLGLRSVVLSGKTVLGKGGKYVLLAPRPAVEEVITTSGVDELFPIFHDEASAIAAVS